MFFPYNPPGIVMPTHAEKRVVPYSADQMYALIADVARYPEFLPWCAAARIRETRPGADGTTVMDADLVIMALGNDANPIIKDSEPRLATSKWGTITLDHSGSQQTTLEGGYTGGDAARGGSTAIMAAGDGQAAAREILGESALSPAELRLSAIPVAPLRTWLPTLAKVAIAWCTAIPTSTHTVIHAAIMTSLTNCAVSLAGVVA